MNWELKAHPDFPGVQGPVVVCVMDGVGIGRADESDSVWIARTPHIDRLGEMAPKLHLAAHGRAVGMPDDSDMGNSEVGHNALGSGRVFDQGAKLVAGGMATGSIFAGETWRALTSRIRDGRGAMHFIGLLSDGNVHSHIDHLYSLLERCDTEAIENVCVHILLDGRDVPEKSALEYVEALEKQLAEINKNNSRDYRIASGGGRMSITMDRYEADWDMVARGWQTHVRGEGRGFATAREAIETLRSEEIGIGDQWLPPFVIRDTNDQSRGAIRDGDSVVFFNFRGDRAIEISRAFESETCAEFERGPRPDVLYAGMMQYDGDLQLPRHYLVEPPTIDRTLGEYLARNGIPQLAISETQKFGHVTYFWNGNRSGSFDSEYETYIEVPSDNVPFDEHPSMKAVEITDRAISELRSGGYRHARINYANGDMVGHTGNRDAAIRAVEAVDAEIGRLIALVDELDGALVLTADHGNADCMYELDAKTGNWKSDAEGQPLPKTSHTLNPVPLYVYAPGHSLQLIAPEGGTSLANVAATTLHLLGLKAPEDYRPSLLANSV